jgi:hypothetical protein
MKTKTLKEWDGILWYVALKFEPRDLWVGVYWNKTRRGPLHTDVFICLIPLFPVQIRKYR